MYFRLERAHIEIQVKVRFWSLMPRQHKAVHLPSSLQLLLIHAVILDVLKLLLQLLIRLDQRP